MTWSWAKGAHGRQQFSNERAIVGNALKTSRSFFRVPLSDPNSLPGQNSLDEKELSSSARAVPSALITIPCCENLLTSHSEAVPDLSVDSSLLLTLLCILFLSIYFKHLSFLALVHLYIFICGTLCRRSVSFWTVST